MFIFHECCVMFFLLATIGKVNVYTGFISREPTKPSWVPAELDSAEYEDSDKDDHPDGVSDCDTLSVAENLIVKEACNRKQDVFNNTRKFFGKKFNSAKRKLNWDYNFRKCIQVFKYFSKNSFGWHMIGKSLRVGLWPYWDMAAWVTDFPAKTIGCPRPLQNSTQKGSPISYRVFVRK